MADSAGGRGSSEAPSLGTAQRLLRDGQLDDALACAEAVLADNPQDGDARYLVAVCHRFARRFALAERTLVALLEQDPENGRALQELAHLARDRGDTPLALRYYERALRSNPALLASLENRARLLRENGRHGEADAAEAQLRKARGIPPPVLAATDLLAQGRVLKAEALCRSFLQQTPHQPEAMRLLAEIGTRLGALEEAHFLLESACELEPDNPRLHIELIRVLGKRQRFSESLAAAERLLERAPDNLQYQSLRAIELLQLGRYDDAIAGFDAILQRLPEDPATLTSRGHALKTCGRGAEAIDAYRHAADRGDHAEAWYALANLKTYRFDDSELARMEELQRAPELAAMERIYLDFALGKAREDRGEYANAFGHFSAGNAMKRRQLGYRREQFTAEVDAQCRELTAARLQSSGGCDAPDPIFIVGMPRAGSTLLEQILASHSAVEGTRELPNILALAQRLRRRADSGGNTPGYPEILAECSGNDFAAMGRDYMEQTRIHRTGSAFFIDKMPNNFRHIGLIHLILPRAKIIDARREPMACCFSNFQQLFAEGQEFSYDLQDVGSYYRDYLRLMAHWDEVLPGRVHRVQHEALLDDFEGELRRLLDYLELPFEEACLHYYDSGRAVRTPSAEQVRQPLYRDAVDKWQNYAPWLQPLREALAGRAESTRKPARAGALKE